MLGLRYSKRSRADLEAIWDFIAFGSPRNAEAVLDRIHEKIERLRAEPLMGHRRDDIRVGARCVNSDGYMIFYRSTAELVRIDRILHHSRNLTAVEFDEIP